MALLVTGNWYEITWTPTSGAAWAVLPSAPAIPAGLIQAIVDAVPIVIYVTSSVTGSFAFLGGTATGFDDTLISAQVGPLTANTWTTDDATNFVYAIDSSGIVWYYDEANQTLRSFPAAGATGSAAMKAFLP